MGVVAAAVIARGLLARAKQVSATVSIGSLVLVGLSIGVVARPRTSEAVIGAVKDRH
jgi:hypothetical protein